MKQLFIFAFASLCLLKTVRSSGGGGSQCDKKAKYRTIDGTCNNLKNPDWGSTGIPLLRLLPNAYSDGKCEPRTKSSDGITDLPGARDVTIKIHNDIGSDGHSQLFTMMVMTYGQFLDHDISRTRMNTEDCGQENCGTNGECFPIKTPSIEEDFKTECIQFVRSFGQTVKGVREQINLITSYIDAGLIYGDDVTTVSELRDTSNSARGRLVTTPHPIPGLKDLLKQDDVDACFNTNDNIKCFLAGDVRVNVQMGLTAVHTIFTRMHNVIEEELYKLNSDWDGETLYQETRRIVVAALQEITYKEYIPIVLGSEAMKKYNLKLMKTGSYWNGYNRKTNPGVFNQFATATFRFGHSQIGEFLRFANAMANIKDDRILSTEMLRPESLYVKDDTGSGIDGVLRGTACQHADAVDIHMSEQMTVHLFTPNAPFGLGSDLASRNIQRGRDHGLKSYTEWRKYCGLSGDLSDIPADESAKLLNAYAGDATAIDLWVGGLAETHVANAMVGPTFACLLGEQFKTLRAGDRFWFENNDKTNPGAFTRAQLKEIRKFTLASVICENGDNIGMIQPKVMLLPLSKVDSTYRKNNKALIDYLYPKNEDNERVKCSEIPKPNFNRWRASHGKYTY